MSKTKNDALRDILGLKETMHTYFLRAPHEYWQAIGTKPQPYDDNVGEYDFIHAFFDTAEEMSNFSDILVSKLEKDGILWVSLPKVSDSLDSSKVAKNTFEPLGMTAHETIPITDKWDGTRFSFK